MPKTYALINITHSLQEDSLIYNSNIFDALHENNITDVYFFTSDMTFTPLSIQVSNNQIQSLLKQKLTVHGVLTVYDLFWGLEPEQLKSLGQNENLKFYMAGDYLIRGGCYERDQVAGIIKMVNNFCPPFADAIRIGKPLTKNILGAAYKDLDKPNVWECQRGAALAVKMFLKCYPAKYADFNGFLLKHFIENKPADCNNCIIFSPRQKKLVPELSSITEMVISGNHDINVVNIEINPKDYSHSAANKEYNSRIRSITSLLNPIKPLLSNASSIVELQNTLNHPSFEWCSWLSRLELNYYTHRGFKLFGYSSDESLNLLTQLKSVDLNIYAKRTMIINYLNNDNNKGKRLYDVLLESLVRESKRLRGSESNLWLTENMLYLIQKKYQVARGFKFFGNSCSDSVALLNKLNDASKILDEKQKLIDDYLANPNFKGKRFFSILNEVRSWDDNAARRYQLKS